MNRESNQTGKLPESYDSDMHALRVAIHAIRSLVQYGVEPDTVLQMITTFDLNKPPEET